MILTGVQTRGTGIARARRAKRLNALAAVLSGGLPALILSLNSHSTPGEFLLGFLIGLIWANGFEYAYHRFLLHLPNSFLARRHREHHLAAGTPFDIEHLNFVESPPWVLLMFVTNGVLAVAADLLFGLGLVPGTLIAFAAYYLAAEEMHWRIHLGGWLPPGLRALREYHLAHHDRPDARFNVFLPLFDWLFGTNGGAATLPDVPRRPVQ